MGPEEVNSKETLETFRKGDRNWLKRQGVKTLGMVLGVGVGCWAGPEIVDYIGSGKVEFLWELTESIARYNLLWDLGSIITIGTAGGFLGNYASKKLGNYLIK